MNPNTGHLIDLDIVNSEEDLKARFMRQMIDYERLPRELEADARRKLNGQPEAQVNLRSSTPLAQWAKKKRREKIAAKSRRRNRR